MSVASELLEDLRYNLLICWNDLLFWLNVRIILLIRDPRGMLQSRKHYIWSAVIWYRIMKPLLNWFKYIETHSSNVHFAYYFKTTCELLIFSGVSRVIRCEDLSLYPFEITEDILKFYRLPFHRNVKKFLNLKTKK